MSKAEPALRVSPLLTLTAGLIALAVFLVHDARPAEAQQTTTAWSATLRAGTIMTKVYGCWNGSSFINWRCTRTVSLTDDDFSHSGASYSITKLTLNVTTEALELVLDKAFPQDIRTSGKLQRRQQPILPFERNLLQRQQDCEVEQHRPGVVERQQGPSEPDGTRHQR